MNKSNQEKKCAKCGESKPLNEFRNDKYTKSGKTTRCKECLKTYNPEDLRCYYCHKWFTKKQSNWKFCNIKCHNNHWSKVWRLSPKGTMYMAEYQRNYQRI